MKSKSFVKLIHQVFQEMMSLPLLLLLHNVVKLPCGIKNCVRYSPEHQNSLKF